MLDGITIHPLTIDTIAIPIMAGILSVYFFLLRPRSQTTWVLAAFFCSGTLLGLMAALTTATRGPLTQYAQFLFLLAAAWLLVAFSYSLQGNAHPRESRWVLGITGAIGLVLSGHILFNLVTADFWREINSLPHQAFSWLLMAYAATIFSRKARLPGYNHRLQRAFAWLMSVPLVTVLSTFVGALALLSRETVVGIYTIGLLLFLIAFGFLYIYHAPVRTSFQVQIVGLSLLTMLAFLAVVNRTSTSPEVIGNVSEVSLDSYVTIDIAPNAAQDGYAATLRAFTFDTDLGERLELEAGTEAIVALDHPFSFAGQLWDTLYVNRNGLIAFGQAYRPRFMDDFYNAIPKIAPLNIALREGDSGGVYAKQERGMVTLTWHQMKQRGLMRTATFQLALFPDGAFSFRYADLDVAITRGMRGVYWGAPRPRWNALLTPLHEQGTTAVLVEDLTHRYKRRVHSRMMPLLYSVLGAALFIVAAFPPLFQLSLMQPITRLLTGMQEVNKGQLDVTLPVATRDEIGRLTEHFNQMTASLRQADQEVRSYAEHLEDMVDERTAQIAEQNDQLAEQAQQLRALDEAKSRFFANISHEFRTPLTLILGPLARAQAEQAVLSSEDQTMMQRNTLRLQRLINQILDLARLEAGNLALDLQTHDWQTFVQRQTSLFQAEATYREIDLVFHKGATSCLVAMDREQMEKVVANLLSNALKFTPAGGRITVSCTPTMSTDGNYAALTVTDTGPGIPAEALPHLFDRFYQVDDTVTRIQEGSGIGLALVQEVVELHGGTVTVTSTLGEGSLFTVRLPLLEEVAALAEEVAIGGQGAPGPYPRVAPSLPTHSTSVDATDQTMVLVVEDNADMRAFIGSILEDEFRVLEARDGEEGLTLAQSHLPDLILADVMMPRMDGLSLSRALKASSETDTIPLLLLSARAGSEDAIEGLATGADAYLTKPFHAEALRLQVQNIIRRQHRLRKQLAGASAVEPPGLQAPSSFEERVRAVINERLADPLLSVEDVAEAFGMTRFQLLRHLQDAAEVKPRQLIMTMRMEKAAALLRADAGSVSEVAYAVGFNSLAYFSHRFRAHFGTSPSSFGD